MELNICKQWPNFRIPTFGHFRFGSRKWNITSRNRKCGVTSGATGSSADNSDIWLLRWLYMIYWESQNFERVSTSRNRTHARNLHSDLESDALTNRPPQPHFCNKLALKLVFNEALLDLNHFWSNLVYFDFIIFSYISWPLTVRHHLHSDARGIHGRPRRPLSNTYVGTQNMASDRFVNFQDNQSNKKSPTIHL